MRLRGNTAARHCDIKIFIDKSAFIHYNSFNMAMTERVAVDLPNRKLSVDERRGACTVKYTPEPRADSVWR